MQGRKGLVCKESESVEVTENDVPPKWRHTRSLGQSVPGRTPGWSGPNGVNNI